MPTRDPRGPQLDNPELVAALLSELQIIGQIGLLDFVPAVNPVFIVGSRGLAINVEPPVYQSAEIFDGTVGNSPANTVIVDTGQLPAGDYDIWANLSAAGFNNLAGARVNIAVEHRNAANAATLATLLLISVGAVNGVTWGHLPQTGYRIALNERIRAITLLQNINSGATASMGVRRRPTP